MAWFPITSGRQADRPAGATEHTKGSRRGRKNGGEYEGPLPKLAGHLRVASGALGALALALVATWAVARAQSPDTSSQPAFIKNLHITGFAQNTSATWIESNNMPGSSARLDHTRQLGSVGLAERKLACG